MQNYHNNDNPAYCCSNGHRYEWHTDNTFWSNDHDKGWNLICVKCRKEFSKPSWECRECEQHLCLDCAETDNFKENMLTKPEILCKKNHALAWSPDTCAYYIEKQFTRNYVFTCKLCLKSHQEPSWHCRDCNYDVCIMCARTKGLAPPRDLLVCDELHPLIRDPSKEKTKTNVGHAQRRLEMRVIPVKNVNLVYVLFVVCIK